MALSACQTTGGEGNPATKLAAPVRQSQIKGLSGAPKQAGRLSQPTVVGIAF